MKRTIYKILLSLLCIITVMLSFTVVASAEISDNEEAVKVEQNYDQPSTDTAFGDLYDTFCENADKILSLFSFIGTLIIALLYKKGLMPGLKNALSSFKDALNEIRKESEKTSLNTQEYGEQLEKLSSELNAAVNETELLKESVKDDRNAKNSYMIKTILYEQTELLADIFLSSSLPEYKKEEVGNRINKMKEIIKNEEEAKQ